MPLWTTGPFLSSRSWCHHSTTTSITGLEQHQHIRVELHMIRHPRSRTYLIMKFQSSPIPVTNSFSIVCTPFRRGMNRIRADKDAPGRSGPHRTSVSNGTSAGALARCFANDRRSTIPKISQHSLFIFFMLWLLKVGKVGLGTCLGHLVISDFGIVVYPSFPLFDPHHL